MCLCLLINIAIVDFESFPSGVQWLTSVLVLACIFAYITWLLSLFFKNGPFLEGFYEPGTYLAASWMARPFDTTFRAQTKLKKQQKRQKRTKDLEIKKEKLEKSLHVSQMTNKVEPIQIENDVLPLTDRPLMSQTDEGMSDPFRTLQDWSKPDQ